MSVRYSEEAGAQGWSRICQQMEAAFSQSRYEDGVLAGVQAVTQHLVAHFPAESDNGNELPDKPVVL